MKLERTIGITLLVPLAALAIVGPFIATDPNLQPALIGGALLRPSGAHWLGTDDLSRDIFARLAHGARISLAIAAIAVTVAAVTGTAIGLMAGASRSAISGAAGRVIDLGLALPRVIVLLVVLAAIGEMSVPLLGAIIGITGWPAVARLVRGETLRLRETLFVTAARALGAPSSRVLLREIFPGTVPAVLVATTLGVADAILLEAGLSFIGVGVRAPDASWGSMILEARDHLADAPWLMLAPCLALVVATSAATLLGEAFRRSLQPDTR